MAMENQTQINFIYSPINDKPPLAVLVAQHEEIVVHEIKKMLLKGLGKGEVSTSRIPLSRTSQDKKYSLLGDFEIIKGINAMNKFVYAFELSDSPHTYTCILCGRICDCELKKHAGKNCLFIVCDFCVNNHFKFDANGYECPVCLASVSKFIKIGESVPAISILYVPLVLDKLNIDMAVNVLCTNFGDPRLIKVPVRDIHSPQEDEYSVHFMYHGDHDCTLQGCFFYQKASIVCDLPAPENKIRKEVLSDMNDNKIPKIEPPIDNSNFKKQIPISHDVSHISQVINQSNLSTNIQNSRNLNGEDRLENFLKIFHQQRDKNLNFFKENSQRIVNEGLQNLTQEFEKLSRSFGKSRPSRNVNPFENLKFSGRNGDMHPVRFIIDFEFIAFRERVTDYEQQIFFGQSLTEDAAKWLSIRGYGRTFPEMRQSFLDFFWSEAEQNLLRNFLKTGKYNKDSGLSMSEYFYKYVYEASYLDNVPDEKTLIYWLTKHFDIMIQAKIYGNHVKNITGALIGLKNLEISDKNGNLETSKTTEPKSCEKVKSPENPGSPEIPKNIKKPKNSGNDPDNFFSSSSTKKVKTGVWKDYFGFEYDQIKKDGEPSYRCITERIWPLHSLSYNNCQSDIRHFDVSCHEASSRFLTDIPTSLNHIYVDINGEPVKLRILFQVTIGKQKGNQLIVSTCPTFRCTTNLVAGQLVYMIENDYYVRPCGVITCSIPEGCSYRYVISNANEQIACLRCKDNIEEIQFLNNRFVAVEDLVVRYFEQKFTKRKHLLRFLNENFDVVYSVWDYAELKYNPLKPTYH